MRFPYVPTDSLPLAFPLYASNEASSAPAALHRRIRIYTNTDGTAIIHRLSMPALVWASDKSPGEWLRAQLPNFRKTFRRHSEQPNSQSTLKGLS